MRAGEDTLALPRMNPSAEVAVQTMLERPTQQVALLGSERASPRPILAVESSVNIEPIRGLAVDASCIGNPDEAEYRGVDLASGEVVFHQSVGWGTNNIEEFLAIVHEAVGRDPCRFRRTRLTRAGGGSG